MVLTSLCMLLLSCSAPGLISSALAESEQAPGAPSNGNDPLPKGIVSPEFPAKKQAIEALLAHDANPASELVKILESDADWERRSLAAQAMQKKMPGWEGFVPALVNATQDQHPYVRRDAIVALRSLRIFSTEVRSALIRAVSHDPVGSIRSQAALTLGSIRPVDDQLIAVLAEAVTGSSIEERAGAADALAEIGPAAMKAMPALVKAIELPDWGSQIHDPIDAMSRIGNTPPEAAPRLLAILKTHPLMDDPMICRRTGEVLAQMGPKISDQLLSALNDPDWCLQIGAATALDQIGSYPPSAKGRVSNALKEYRRRLH
jgi:HEAT repeat protein